MPLLKWFAFSSSSPSSSCAIYTKILRHWSSCDELDINLRYICLHSLFQSHFVFRLFFEANTWIKLSMVYLCILSMFQNWEGKEFQCFLFQFLFLDFDTVCTFFVVLFVTARWVSACSNECSYWLQASFLVIFSVLCVHLLVDFIMNAYE